MPALCELLQDPHRQHARPQRTLLIPRPVPALVVHARARLGGYGLGLLDPEQIAENKAPGASPLWRAKRQTVAVVKLLLQTLRSI